MSDTRFEELEARVSLLEEQLRELRSGYNQSKPLHPFAFHEKQVGPKDSNSRCEVWCYERHSRKWELRIADRGDTHWMPHWGLPLP